VTGKIPSEIGLLTQLNKLNISSNHLSGTIPSSLCSADTGVYIDCNEVTCDSGCCRSGDKPYPIC
jgi:Leucine-rich repeat (LRR) protein